jgi:hypothetical protein
VLALNDCDVLTQVSQPVGQRRASLAGADDNRVVVGHRTPLSQPRKDR